MSDARTCAWAALFEAVEVFCGMLAKVSIAIDGERNEHCIGLHGNWGVIYNLVCGCFLHCGAGFRTAVAVTVVGLHNGDVKHILNLIGLVMVLEEDDIGLDGSAIRTYANLHFLCDNMNWDWTG